MNFRENIVNLTRTSDLLFNADFFISRPLRLRPSMTVIEKAKPDANTRHK